MDWQYGLLAVACCVAMWLIGLKCGMRWADDGWVSDADTYDHKHTCEGERFLVYRDEDMERCPIGCGVVQKTGRR